MDGIGVNGLPSCNLQKQVIDHVISLLETKGEKSTEHIDSLKLIPFQGTSMMPTLVAGDILVVSPIIGNTPDPGDILLREKEANTFVAHRVTRFDASRSMVFTCGDSQLFRDAGWNLEKSAGRVIGIWRNNGLIGLPSKPSLLKKTIVIAKLLAYRGVKRFRRLLETITYDETKYIHKL